MQSFDNAIQLIRSHGWENINPGIFQRSSDTQYTINGIIQRFDQQLTTARLLHVLDQFIKWRACFLGFFRQLTNSFYLFFSVSQIFHLSIGQIFNSKFVTVYSLVNEVLYSSVVISCFGKSLNTFFAVTVITTPYVIYDFLEIFQFLSHIFCSASSFFTCTCKLLQSFYNDVCRQFA